MLFLQLPSVAVPKQRFLASVRDWAQTEYREFAASLPTWCCILVALAGCTLSLLAFLLLYLVEGEPITWGCQGMLALWLNVGQLTTVFGALFLPMIFRRFGYKVGRDYV